MFKKFIVATLLAFASLTSFADTKVSDKLTDITFTRTSNGSTYVASRTECYQSSGCSTIANLTGGYSFDWASLIQGTKRTTPGMTQNVSFNFKSNGMFTNGGPGAHMAFQGRSASNGVSLVGVGTIFGPTDFATAGSSCGPTPASQPETWRFNATGDGVSKVVYGSPYCFTLADNTEYKYVYHGGDTAFAYWIYDATGATMLYSSGVIPFANNDVNQALHNKSTGLSWVLVFASEVGAAIGAGTGVGNNSSWSFQIKNIAYSWF